MHDRELDIAEDEISAYTNAVTLERLYSGEFSFVYKATGPSQTFIAKIARPNTNYDTELLLEREEAVLDLVYGEVQTQALDPPVAIPEPLGHTYFNTHHPEKLLWMICRFIPGVTLSRTEMRQRFSEADCIAYGEKIADVVYFMSRAIDIATLERETDDRNLLCPIDREAQLTRCFPGKVERLARKGFPALAAEIKKLGRDYRNLGKKGLLAARFVGQDDLHPGNCILSDEVGINFDGLIDFSHTKRSSFPREIRFLPLLHAAATQAAIKRWHALTGESIEESAVAVDFWTRTQSTMRCVDTIEARKPIAPDAKEDMHQLFPDVNWQTEFGTWAKRLAYEARRGRPLSASA